MLSLPKNSSVIILHCFRLLVYQKTLKTTACVHYRFMILNRMT